MTAALCTLAVFAAIFIVAAIALLAFVIRFERENR